MNKAGRFDESRLIIQSPPAIINRTGKHHQGNRQKNIFDRPRTVPAPRIRANIDILRIMVQRLLDTLSLQKAKYLFRNNNQILPVAGAMLRIVEFATYRTNIDPPFVRLDFYFGKLKNGELGCGDGYTVQQQNEFVTSMDRALPDFGMLVANSIVFANMRDLDLVGHWWNCPQLAIFLPQ